MKKTKIIFVSSPCRGDTELKIRANYWYANSCCKLILENTQYLPIAPHLYLPQFNRDKDLISDERALIFCKELLTRADELWVFCRRGISVGMQEEIKEALAQNKLIRFITTIEDFEEAYKKSGE